MKIGENLEGLRADGAQLSNHQERVGLAINSLATWGTLIPAGAGGLLMHLRCHYRTAGTIIAGGVPQEVDIVRYETVAQAH